LMSYMSWDDPMLVVGYVYVGWGIGGALDGLKAGCHNDAKGCS
jgi:hypothetical protein